MYMYSGKKSRQTDDLPAGAGSRAGDAVRRKAKRGKEDCIQTRGVSYTARTRSYLADCFRYLSGLIPFSARKTFPK